MKIIYKYPLAIKNRVVCDMPRNSEILSIQMQNGVPTIWAIVDMHGDLTERAFQIFGTGQRIPNRHKLNHIGTLQHRGFVWHVFEEATNG